MATMHKFGSGSFLALCALAEVLAAFGGASPAASPRSAASGAPARSASGAASGSAAASNQWSPDMQQLIAAAQKEGHLDLSWGPALLGGSDGVPKIGAAMNKMFGTTI